MSCGCKEAPRPVQTKAKAPRIEGGVSGIVVERAAICQTCLWGETHDRVVGVVSCTISGRAIVDHLHGARCPKGKHPDRRGVTRFVGVRWYGVPMPVRAWVWLTGTRHIPLRAWRLCGCAVVPKVAWRLLLRTRRRLYADRSGLQRAG